MFIIRCQNLIVVLWAFIIVFSGATHGMFVYPFYPPPSCHWRPFQCTLFTTTIPFGIVERVPWSLSAPRLQLRTSLPWHLGGIRWYNIRVRVTRVKCYLTNARIRRGRHLLCTIRYVYNYWTEQFCEGYVHMFGERYMQSPGWHNADDTIFRRRLIS